VFLLCPFVEYGILDIDVVTETPIYNFEHYCFCVLKNANIFFFTSRWSIHPKT
jgi:hypothetical protein